MMNTSTIDLLDTVPVSTTTPDAAEPGPVASRTRRVWRGLLGAVGGLLLVTLLGVALAAIAVPAVVGATPLAVLTSSMEPGYPAGTLVVVKPAEPEQITVGDVVTYQVNSGRPEVVTHRVTEVSIDAAGDHLFQTQGDNNERPDPRLVREVQLKGELLYAVPVLGWAQNALGGEARAILVPVIAGALFLYAAVNVAGAIIARRRRDLSDTSSA